jgi:hypothetical protein
LRNINSFHRQGEHPKEGEQCVSVRALAESCPGSDSRNAAYREERRAPPLRHVLARVNAKICQCVRRYGGSADADCDVR